MAYLRHHAPRPPLVPQRLRIAEQGGQAGFVHPAAPQVLRQWMVGGSW